jgi:alkylation response protein AidB-like acyl-CoA dehydrogenase
MHVDDDLLGAVRDTARRFAARDVAPMLAAEGRDGDLSKVPELLARAASIGLIPAPGAGDADPGAGIWARSAGPATDLISVALVEEVAVACAGFAACLHHAGLAARDLDQDPAGRAVAPAIALFGPGWRPDWRAFLHPPDGAASLRDGRLNGRVGPVHAPPGCGAFIVYASGPGGWERALVMRDAPGLAATDPGPRTGLAALDMVFLGFTDVGVAARHALGPATPLDYLRRLFLGLAAIALGNARGALMAAERYARERRQGGRAIDEHPAVRLLLGDARSRVAAAGAHLSAAAAPGPDAAWRAVAARLRVTAQCHSVVSDCLQVLGGYGYIEDYRLEKRLRDSLTLAGSAIDPNALRLMCAGAPDGT